MFSGKRYHGHAESIQSLLIGVEPYFSRAIESRRLINVFQLTSAGPRELNIHRVLAFVHEQNSPLPFLGNHRHRIDVRIVSGEIFAEPHNFIARAEVVMQ